MSISRTFHIVIIVLLGTACKKAEFYMNDPEDGLALDTAIFLKSVNYVSSTPTQLVVNVDMVKFNGKESETAYGSETMYDSVVDIFETTTAGISYSIGLPSTVPLSPINTYSSVFLFVQQNAWWYQYYHVAPFVQRYYQQIESVDTKNNGVIFIEQESTSDLGVFSNDSNSTTIFNTPWRHNIDQLVHRTQSEGEFSTQGKLTSNKLMVMFDKTTDTLKTIAGFNAQRSLTLFIDSPIDDVIANELKTIVDSANANSVQMNFIGADLGHAASIIAGATGGFVIDGFNYVDFVDQQSWSPPNPVKNVGVALTNLDALLSNNLTVERRTITVNASAGTPFTSGQVAAFTFRYNNQYFEAGTRIP